MKKTLLLWIFILFSVPASAYQKGIVLGLYAKDPSYSYEKDLEEIRATGADHVSLVVSWYQKNIHASDLYPHWVTKGDFDTTSDAKLIEVIRQAHANGLKVFLFPIVRLEERAEKEWRGVLAPTRKAAWLKSYRNFTLHYARLAAKNGVELFSIGSELCSMEQEEAYWRKLILNVRGFYRGQLLYSANWDHYKKIAFWDALDYLGLNGYYELAQKDAPAMEDLLKSWWDIQNDLATWQDQNHDKPILFTEIGYPSVVGGCRKPWDYTRQEGVDLKEQALGYEAFFVTWGKSPRLGGVYFWNWYGQGGENDRSYTPRGKPAQKILTEWYQKADPSSPPPSVSGASPAPPQKTNPEAASSAEPPPSL